MSFRITKEQLSELLPKNKDIDEWYDILSELMPSYGIDTPERVAGFIAQCAHESAQFTIIKENLNYSEKALDRVFAKYFKKAGRDAAEYARQPEKIANIVYADRMGNGNTASGDGWKYRGRGVIQLTGRNNYEAFANATNRSLDNVVEYLETKLGAAESACWFWKSNGLNELADKKDIRGMTRRINGGYNGIKDRTEHWEHALEVLGKESHSPKSASAKESTKKIATLKMGDIGEDVKVLQRLLGVQADGIFGRQTNRALRVFQRNAGIEVDGLAGPATMQALREKK